MLVIGTFKCSFELEQALGELEHDGISRQKILIVQMDAAPKNTIEFLGGPRDLHANAIEVGMASATASAVIGTAVGFSLELGPILWGLIATFIGFNVGYWLYLFIKKGLHTKRDNDLPEVIVIVQTSREQSVRFIETMWKYGALTVGKASEVKKDAVANVDT